MIKKILRSGSLLLLFPVLAFGMDDVLMDEATLSFKLDRAQDYQLLDARSAQAQRDAPIAFSTRYEPNTAVKGGLVLVVADTDAAASAIARAIVAGGADRAAFAVKGGYDSWQRVARKSSASTSIAGGFVIPKNTCEQGKPIQELKRNKPLQHSQKT